MGYSMPVVLNYTDAIYANAGVAFPDLKHLDALGLIDFNSASTFSRLNLPARGMIAYFDRSLLLEFSEDATSNEVDTGHTIFTRAGAELVEITHAVPVPGFLDYVQEVWQRTDGLTLRLEP